MQFPPLLQRWMRLHPLLWLLPGFAGVIALYADHARKASLSIDGQRWFWLDDDQMISMRYARNLAEGHGLVWNPGEYVEGYTNFGWTLVMAAVHLLRLPERLTPLAMAAVSCLFCLVLVYLAARLLQRLEPRRLALTLPALLVCMLTCTDVMFWAAAGFETVLVTSLHLWAVLRTLQGSSAQGRALSIDAKLLVPLALIPVARSDGMHIWLGDALLVLLLAADRKRAALGLLMSLAPFAAHLSFRLWYYGDLLPNTYYLKVAGLDNRWGRGLLYVRSFGQRYWLPLVLALGTMLSLWRRDRRALSLLTTLVPPALYSAQMGGDVFSPFRFFAHAMPELFLWGALGAARLLATPYARLAWLLALAGFVMPPLSDPLAHIAPVGTNGDPFEQVVVAVQLRKNASPNSSIAVIPAGFVPYFTRLKAFDLLGKTDAHVAHLEPKKGALVGHGKIDPEYTLGKRPDYVISCRPRSIAQNIPPLPPEGSIDYLWTLLASRPFRSDYEPNPLPDPFMLERSAVYVRRGSPEIVKIATWQGVSVQR
jgi:arabinofuranosyltransferase